MNRSRLNTHLVQFRCSLRRRRHHVLCQSPALSLQHRDRYAPRLLPLMANVAAWLSVSSRCCHSNMRRTTPGSWFGWNPVGHLDEVAFRLRRRPAGGPGTVGHSSAAVIRGTGATQCKLSGSWAGLACRGEHVARRDWHQSQLSAGGRHAPWSRIFRNQHG